jgi:putative transposase
MARPPRFDVPGIPQHVVQRGNNRLPCFLDDDDRQRYLQCLLQALPRYRCRLHAYVLMDNHAHLLLTPDEAGALSRLMHAFGRNYAGLFNRRHDRTGTLWEGRFKACLVERGRYFLACSRYIELNPVRAHMVALPGRYAWSSFRANAGGAADPLLTPHPEYLALGCDSAARASAYRALFAQGLSGRHVDEIRTYLQQQKPLGSKRFRAWVESRAGRFATARAPGRPIHREFVPGTLAVGDGARVRMTMPPSSGTGS